MRAGVIGMAAGAMALGLVALLAASLRSGDVSGPQIAQTPLDEKQRQDLLYQQRLDDDKARRDGAAAAARAQAEEDARRRAADLLRQQNEDASRQQQLNNLDRYRSDQPQPFIRR